MALMKENSLNLDFSAGETSPEKAGFTRVGIEKVLEIFYSQVKNGLHPGAQLVVARNGRVVIDRVAGLANEKRKIEVTHDTPFLTFSCAKAFTGMCIHKLIDENSIQLHDAIAKYWPKFAKGGKGSATLQHAFLHQMGIPSSDLDLVFQIPLWPFWSLVIKNVENLKAKYPPGTRTGYHMINYGFVLGELVRIITGTKIENYLRNTFLEPMKLENTYMGLPYSQFHRASTIYASDQIDWKLITLFKLPFIRHASIPAATLYSTARDLACFYYMLLNKGRYRDKEYVSEKTIQNATSLGYEGYDEVVGGQMRWAYGFHLGGLNDNQKNGMGLQSTMQTFGHFGQDSCMVWADKKYQIVVAFTCNRLLGGDLTTYRWQSISDAVWNAVLV